MGVKHHDSVSVLGVFLFSLAYKSFPTDESWKIGRRICLSGFVNRVLNLSIWFLKKKGPQFKKVYGIGFYYNEKNHHLMHYLDF